MSTFKRKKAQLIRTNKAPRTKKQNNINDCPMCRISEDIIMEIKGNKNQKSGGKDRTNKRGN